MTHYTLRLADGRLITVGATSFAHAWLSARAKGWRLAPVSEQVG